MVTIENLFDNPNIRVVESKGDVTVYEYLKDLSVGANNAINAYFASKMNVRKRQAIIKLENNEYTISAGAMLWTSGSVHASADVKGVGDLIGKAFAGKATKESSIKPKYSGTGILALETTYKHLLLEEVSDWGELVLEDGLFLACESRVNQKVVARSNLSSAVMGNEGLFNLCLRGQGIAVLESPIPREELMIVNLSNDEFRLDGSFAIAWSNSLNFTVEKSTKSLIGSAVSGEGLVNVYRGTGKILVAPVF